MRKYRTFFIVGLIIIVGSFIAFFMHKEELTISVKEMVRLEYGQKESENIEDYIVLDNISDEEKNKILSNGEIKIDDSIYNENNFLEIGEYSVAVSYNNQVNHCRLIVEDTTPPQFMSDEDIVIDYGNEEYDFEEKIKATDLQDVTYTYDRSEIQFNKAGDYTLHVIAQDSSGNKSEKDFVVTIKPKEETKVTITSPQNNTVQKTESSKQTTTQSSTTSKNSSSTTQKNTETTQLSLKSTGNTQLDQKCDEIINSIISSQMSDREKAYAVYTWVENNIRYSGVTAIGNWQSGALKTLSTRKGNCAGYCYVSEALLTRLNFENIEVHGTNDEHLWNMVKVNGNWYHFDTTRGWGQERFLWTTTQMKNYSYYNSSLNETITYSWDASAYPATPN